jgi:DNA polymerase I
MRKVGYLIPNKEDMNTKNNSYNGFRDGHIQGAYIFPPVEGFHADVYQIDVSSLYPSMIDLHGIGYESVQCNHEECKTNIVPGHEFHICTKHPSLLSLIIGTLKDVRVDMKHFPEKYSGIPVKDVSGSAKVLLNATYGVFGDDDNETLFVRMVAEAVTAYGRDTLVKSGEIAKQHKATIIGGDTDSLFLKDVDRNVAESIMRDIRDKLGVSMELENEFRFMVIHRKKNYIGVTQDGRLVIKGLLGKKRHVPLFIKQSFSEVLDIIKSIESKDAFTKSKDRIEQSVRDHIALLRARKVPLDQLAFTVWLSKDMMHGKGQAYDAARFAINHGVKFSETNHNMSYVLTTGNVSAKPLGFVTSEEVNIEGYMKHFESYIGNQLLDRLGMNFKSIAYGGDLDKWIVEE